MLSQGSFPKVYRPKHYTFPVYICGFILSLLLLTSLSLRSFPHIFILALNFGFTLLFFLLASSGAPRLLILSYYLHNGQFSCNIFIVAWNFFMVGTNWFFHRIVLCNVSGWWLGLVHLPENPQILCHVSLDYDLGHCFTLQTDLSTYSNLFHSATVTTRLSVSVEFLSELWIPLRNSVRNHKP